MAEAISVLLVDDHSVVRQGVRAFLITQADLTVVGEAASGEEAVKLAEQFVPDVMVTYGATKYLKLVKNGNSYSLYYGTTDVQVGTTQTIADMNGTIHGLFSTGGGTFDSFQLAAT